MKTIQVKQNTEILRHREWDAQASRRRGTQVFRHQAKNYWANKAPRQRAEELRLDGELTKAAKRKRGGGEGAAPDPLAIKKIKVWWCTFSKGSAPLSFSDVAGAFDKVKSELLVLKFQSHGIHSRMIEVIRSWLQRRRAAVVVGGGRSAEFSIENQVFRGTMKGPIH